LTVSPRVPHPVPAVINKEIAMKPACKAGGRWNTVVVTVSARDGRFPQGRIGLQFNAGPIKFRKLVVKEL
jgi:hypothetical protein